MLSKRKILLIRDAEKPAPAGGASGDTYELAVGADPDGTLRRLFSAGQPLPDVIVLDLQGNNDDCKKYLRALRANERTRNVPIVILSASTDAKDLSEFFAGGANSYMYRSRDAELDIDQIGIITRYWLTVNRPLEP